MTGRPNADGHSGQAFAASRALAVVHQRQVIDCREWGDLQLPIDDLQINGRLQIYDSISGSKYLRLRLSGNTIVLSATHYVGHIPLNDRLALNVLPRFGISNLTRILRIADHSPVKLEQFVRGYSATNESFPSLLADLAQSFLRAVEVVVRNGLLQEYRPVSTDTTHPKGRIRLSATVSTHIARGNRVRAAVTSFERFPDTAENQLLKYAMWLLELRFRGILARRGVLQMRTKLNRYYRFFQNVQLHTRRDFLEDSRVGRAGRVPSSRAYYAEALELARLLVANGSVDLSSTSGVVMAPSMLIDLQVAFEAYLRNCLADYMKTRTKEVRVLDGNVSKPIGASKPLFDEPKSQPATPDIVLDRLAKADVAGPALIIEVKYKEALDRDDLNQAITYAASYRAARVVVAHVTTGRDSALGLEGNIAGIAVYRYAFAVSGDLPTEELKFVEAMSALCPEAKADHQRGEAAVA